MRILITPEFKQKVTSLSPKASAALAVTLKYFEKLSKEQIINEKSVLRLPNDIYIVRAQDARIYFFFSSDVQGEFVMLLDLTEAQWEPVAKKFFAAKDPRLNSALNPKFNSAINPRFNSTINPRFNSTINPKINSMINPKFNSMINPKFNSTINPKFNSMINPRFNSTINPRYNSLINPRLNSTFGGPFVYSLELNQEGYLVRVNDQISLIFNMVGEFVGHIVSHDSGVSMLFNTDNNWIGYLVPTGQDPLLKFDVENNWVGIVV